MLRSAFANGGLLVFMPVGSPSTVEDDFLSRLEQTGATESSSTFSSVNQMEEQEQVTNEQAKSILQNVVTTINNLWCLKDGLHNAVLTKLPRDGKIMVLYVIVYV